MGSHLPHDAMESQLSMIQLIRAMYPPISNEPEDAFVEELISRVHQWCENPTSATATSRLPASIDFNVLVELTVESDGVLSNSIEFNITVPLSIPTDDEGTDPPPIKYSLRQPPWMSRAEIAELAARMPSDDVLAAFDYIQENAPRQPQQTNSTSSERQQNEQIGTNQGPLFRIWFYFPSLSTREKRKDLVTYASRYHLTGFVLAGKPGVLCLEGTSRDVDGYMNAIKNESWGDIPSHQKKVSERFREEVVGGQRKFKDMTEITDVLGERRGARKNRGDMAALEAYLKEKGVGDSFGKVVMGQ